MSEDIKYRILTPVEMGNVIVKLRKLRLWSQEQLAEISKLHVKTIQRVENGKKSSLDTRRALALAFEAEDIDIFNKPIPNFDSYIKEQEEIEKNTRVLSLELITSARQLRTYVENSGVVVFDQLSELTNEAELEYANLKDYMKDYADIWKEVSEIDKVDFTKDIQTMLSNLTNMNYSMGVGTRKMKYSWGTGENNEPIFLNELTFIIGSKKEFPSEIRVSKSSIVNL